MIYDDDEERLDEIASDFRSIGVVVTVILAVILLIDVVVRAG